ncbi:AfsR/SARP family transcriptional regulator [Deinococcus humi]|uniref:DNA-binding SARP family transcriptional activator n=1 Tax=Deinococcus humi TaxID=662880 RepID=A0A7W8JXD9_9DEIO|nr:BTAD domain-containing putative transcriptional regulator [Deinococcus humi]MBB5363491.1 DNA-binding SARP family transcriptional activator [Deinococcus humi]GGO30527.1 hypothetical protein GCM10008949_25510 [Deinococcus humi]
MLQVLLFGVFQAQDTAGRPLALESQRARELLSFLLLHPHQPHSREVLASTLWGGEAGMASTAQSLKGLRQALWHLHSALPPGLHAGLLHLTGDRVELRSHPNLSCDALTFEGTVRALQGRTGPDLTPAEAWALRAAVALYRGDLLEGWMADWCLAERERLQNLHLAALEKLTDHCEAYGDWEGGLHYAGRLLAFDRASEDTHRRVMRLHFRSGHRTAALRQFALCELALREELGVRPSHATLALYEGIRDDQPLETASGPPTVGLTTPDSALELLNELRAAVRELRNLLADGGRLREEP